MKTLKKWREELGMSQMKFAVSAGIAYSGIHNLDNLDDWSHITVTVVQKTANALGIGLEEFLEYNRADKKTLSIYYAETDGFNSLIYVHEPTQKAKCISGDHRGFIDGVVDLYGENAVAELKKHFVEISADLNNFHEICGDCNNNIFDFDASEFATLKLVYSE